MYTYFNDEKLRTLNNSELSVFNYIRQNITDISNLTIGELADLTFVSKTTIVRMTQKLGFEGFAEFKYFLKNFKEEKTETIDIDLMQKIRAHDLSTSLAMIDPLQIRKLVKLMRHKNITFFGKGLSNLPCSYAMTQFSLMDVQAVSYENTHIAKQKGERMGRNDVLFLISASGETSQCVQLANIVKGTEATIVTLTVAGSNTISRLADIPLFVIATEDRRTTFDNLSRIPFMMVLEYILDVYIDEMSKE